MRCMNLKMSSCCTLICRPTRSPVASRASLSAAIVVSVSSNDTNMIIANGMFTMIMFVSFDETETTMAALKDALEATGERVGLQINVQHEDIFKFMHRI